MKIISAETPLSEAILADPSIIPVINRLGIALGTGDATVKEVAADHNLSPDFLVTIINTFTCRDYFPVTALGKLDRATMLRYLELTYRYYLHFQIPNVERHFNALVASCPDNSSLTLLRRLFDKARADLIKLIETDMATMKSTEIALDNDAATAVEEVLADLLSMIVGNISGNYDPNLCYATVVAVAGLRDDLARNNRIRSLITLR